MRTMHPYIKGGAGVSSLDDDKILFLLHYGRKL